MWVDLLERLSSFSRLILLDKRGTGLSDRTRDLPNLETRMDDIRAVMDATHSERAALLGTEEGGQIAAVFAASYRSGRAHCVSTTPSRVPRALRTIRGAERRRSGATGSPRYANAGELWSWPRNCSERTSPSPPSGAGGPITCAIRVSPGAALALYRAYGETDIRDVLPAIRVPTLVLYRPYAREPALDLARRIPGAVAQRSALVGASTVVEAAKRLWPL